jgi:UDP-glucose 6-dehydrogenase
MKEFQVYQSKITFSGLWKTFCFGGKVHNLIVVDHNPMKVKVLQQDNFDILLTVNKEINESVAGRGRDTYCITLSSL